MKEVRKIQMEVIMKKIFLGIFIFILTLAIFNIAYAGVAADNDPATKIAPEVQQQLTGLQPGEMVTVIVTLKDQFRPDNIALQNIPNRQQVVLGALQSHAQIAQQAISAALETDHSQGRVANVIPFWIFNGLSVTATSDVIQELAARMDVLSITPDTINIVPVGTQNLAAPAE